MTNTKASDAMQPLSYAILSALTPRVIDRIFYDDRIENIPLDEPTDLVVMSVDTFSARRAYAISDQYRKRNIPVIMGGFHPTLCPQEASGQATSIAVGDAESIWPAMLDDFREKRMKPIYYSKNTSGTLNTVFDRTIYSDKKYVPLSVVQWGRGCPHQCDFCSIHGFYKNLQCIRPIEDILPELDTLRKHVILFVDDNIYHKKNEFMSILKELTLLKIKWACQISLDVAKDKILMKLLQESGCVAAIIGFESLNKDNLIQMGKRWNGSDKEFVGSIAIFRDHGIMIYGTFVFGYDEDTPDSFKKCLDFAIRSRLFLANFNPLTPIPGTTLYDRLCKENRMIYERWWMNPEYRYGQAIFHPKKMTAEELTEGCYETRKAFNKINSIAYRMLDFKANASSVKNMGIYLLSNMINRREIMKKQGRVLGA
jgi:radical SAM superfamily enzyme YgiQ (UPF0313 family)